MRVFEALLRFATKPRGRLPRDRKPVFVSSRLWAVSCAFYRWGGDKKVQTFTLGAGWGVAGDPETLAFFDSVGGITAILEAVFCGRGNERVIDPFG